MTLFDAAVGFFGLWCFARLVRVYGEQSEKERWDLVKRERIQREVWIARLHGFGIDSFHGRVK